jgi:hypothetical protein
MGARVLSVAVLVLGFGAAAGCGGGGSGDEPAPPPPAETTTTTEPVTTTTVSAEAFKAAICDAGFSVKGKSDIAGTYALSAEAYGKVVPPPDRKAELDALVAASRGLATVWSDAAPITTEAFSDQMNKLLDAYNDAATKLRVDCPPQPGVTTTLATAIKATSRLYDVVREEKGKGLWWYTSFACPEGKTLKLGPELKLVPGETSAAAVLDEAAGAADPFTGALANASYDRIDEKITATCV